MQRWRFLKAWIDGRAWYDSAGRNGDLPMAHGDNPSLTSLLNDLGEQGWGVIDSLRGYDDGVFKHQRLLLKRSRA